MRRPLQVLRFLLRPPAELRARITQATAWSTHTSSKVAEVDGFHVGHNKVRSHNTVSFVQTLAAQLVDF